MYIVKRPFRNVGRIITVGSVISEPAEIKHFDRRLSEGKIIYVKDEEFAKAKAFFKAKYGVDIPDKDEPAVKKTATKKPSSEETNNAVKVTAKK